MPRRLLLLAGLVAVSGSTLPAVNDGGDWDFIVVGSGPGGATIARLLSDPTLPTTLNVLLLEAGEDHDTDSLIADPSVANVIASQNIAQYNWPHRTLYNNETAGDDAYIPGRLLGGSSSINGMQYVMPSQRYLERLYVASGSDPDWRPSQTRSILTKLEHFSSQPFPAAGTRGTQGPLAVRTIPGHVSARTSGAKFVQAVTNALGLAKVDDYNDPDTDIGPFEKWQVTQYNNASAQPAYRRASSSVAMLTKTVRARANLKISTGSTALFIKFDTSGAVPKANAVHYTKNGEPFLATASQGVIVAAGPRSSLLLESSGVGNADIIQTLLQDAGLPFVANVPGVGEGLGNDGILIFTFSRNLTDVVSTTPSELWSGGGAFLPHPLGNNENTNRGSRRFSQWFIQDPAPGSSAARRLEEMMEKRKLHATSASKYVLLYASLLDVKSRGYIHIQSADPLAPPAVTTNALQSHQDFDNWKLLLTKQLLPIAEAFAEVDANYTLIDPPMSLLVDGTTDTCSSTGGTTTHTHRRRLHTTTASVAHDDALEAFIASEYHHTHHWFGSCRMGPWDKGGVVDFSGKVHNVTNLYVADSSIIPIKPDGNTQVPAYLMGAMVAKKILKSLFP